MPDNRDVCQTLTPEVFSVGQIITIDPSLLDTDILLASQQFVTPGDIEPAKLYDGDITPFYKTPPIVYIARLIDREHIRTYIIVGDGHHRIGMSLMRGNPINASVDAILPDINLEELALIHDADPHDLSISSRAVRDKIIQRGSYTGISDIIPFESFLEILSSYLDGDKNIKQ